LERLGVPKREVLNTKSGHKSKTKSECAEAKIVEKPKENTHISHFHNRARAKKKEVEEPKWRLKNGKRDLAPNRGQNEAFWHPKGHQIGAKIESKKRHEKRCVKKVLSRTEAARDRSSIGPVSVQSRLGIEQGSVEPRTLGSGPPLTLN